MIRFESPQGLGTLDVAKYVNDRFGGKLTGVKDGIVQFVDPAGKKGFFSLGKWAENNQATVIFMEGFNNPETALDQPPLGMNYFDQVVFFQDGMDMNALMDMFPRAMQDEDGTVKVLDSDGLWKIMWSSDLREPEAPMTDQEMVHEGLANDPRLIMRTAGVHILFGLCGKIPSDNKTGGVKLNELVEVLKLINRNSPIENKFVIGQLITQTTGVDAWKLTNAMRSADEFAKWMKLALKSSSFQYRVMQANMAEDVVNGMRAIAQNEFNRYTEPLMKQPETASLLVNLKQVFGEFVQMLVSLDLMRDISRATGLQEWIALNEEVGFDKSKLPEMPAFVEKFVKLLRAVLPIVQNTPLSMARGKTGLRGIFHLMRMIDDCIFSLVDVPDHSAKYKMFMALKRVQTQLENKLSFHYQPDPLKNRDGLKENPFMQAREQYSESREMVYKLCQTPKESWNNTVLEGLRGSANIEHELDKLPKGYAELMKSLMAMDAAYDMQPWVDVDHADRTHDAFSEENESFGLRPPEAGYLAKNSPRAVASIAEALIEGAAVMSEMPDYNVKETLRNPYLLKQMLQMLQKAAVNRELGTVEVINKFGGTDPDRSPDPNRIFEDPENVEREQQRQIAEIAGQMAERQAMQNAQQEKQAVAQAQAQQQGEPEKAGKGPQRAPAPQMRGAA